MTRHWLKFIALASAATLFLAPAWAGAAQEHRTFGSPQDAVTAFIVAAKAHDTKALIAILGPGSNGLVNSGDPVADRNGREIFVKAYEESNKLDMQGDAKAILSIGKDAWTMPIPIVKAGSAWRFDTKQGAEEILNRRIGRNELSTIQALGAYVDAQREYYLANPAKDKLLQYAQKVVSTQGKRDGLYYPTKAGEAPSPLGNLFDSRAAAGYKSNAGKPAPYYGYNYRILKAQGPDAKGGAYDYVARGKMIGGFGMVASPATYGNSGITTFIVNQDGVVYEKDLGPNTAALAQKITKFNPDKSWKRHDTK